MVVLNATMVSSPLYSYFMNFHWNRHLLASAQGPHPENNNQTYKNWGTRGWIQPFSNDGAVDAISYIQRLVKSQQVWPNTGFPSGASGKEPIYQCRKHKRHGFNSWGRFPGGRHVNPLQYICLENPMDRGAWQSTVHGVANSQTRLKRLSMHAHVTKGTSWPSH